MATLVTNSNRPRKSEEERLEELQKQLEELKARVEEKSRRDLPVVRDYAKVEKVLRTFMQTAMDHGREDVAISVQAFLAGTTRMLDRPEEEEAPRRRGSRGESSAFGSEA